MFIIGAIIAKYRLKIKQKIFSFSVKIKIALFLIGIVLYLYAHPSFLLNILIVNFPPFYRTVIDTWFTSIGAGILIVFAISSTHFTNLLRKKFVIFIGKISYSLYLMHLAILFSFIHLLNGIIPMWEILILAILSAFVISSLTYFFVEIPAIKLGKYLTRPKINKKDKQPKVTVPF